MTHVRPLDQEQVDGRSRVLLEEIRRDLGFVPPLMRLLSQAPAALAGYLALRTSLEAGSLPATLRERIAIAVAAMNLCDACLQAHTRFGQKAGLSAEELADATRARAAEPAAAAVLAFARVLVETRGPVDEDALAALRGAGFDDGAIVEIAAVTATNIFANIVNNLAHAAPDICGIASDPPG